MPARRTVAPDIVGCSFLLYGATLAFAVLRAPYAHHQAVAIGVDFAVYGGLLAVCVIIAIGLFRRRGWVLWPAVVLSAWAFFAGLLASYLTETALVIGPTLAGLLAGHVPETAQLPAGVLGAASVVLLLGRRVELGDQNVDEPADGEIVADAQE